MHYCYRNYLKPYAKKLRNEMTKEERKLWYDFLQQLPITILRQKPIGKYIVDFYFPEGKIVIELDGSQHYEEKGEQQDKVRNEYFNSLGIKVLRYSNYQVNKLFDAVCADIYSILEKYL
jgi:very-short-patch-repair endonuclease